MTVNFKDNLNGGNLKSPNEEIIGLSIYRMRSGEARLFHLVDVPLTETRLMDYGFRNQEACQYFLFPQGEQTYISAPLTSVEVRPASWNWTLLVCREDENGVFHEETQYVFRNNVVSGSVTNNSSPGILKNFTPYPVIQPDSSNYRAGTLSALIGRVDMVNNVYEDSIRLAEELYALAADIRPKFLKDRKGNLMRVEVSSAIVMTVGDNQAPQPYTIQLPWAECGDAADASIIKTEADGIPSSICST